MTVKKQYMVGLSGGVDSATTAALLMQQHLIQPIFMQNWEEDDHCHISEDIQECQNICQHLGCELLTVNFRDAYFSEVFQHSLDLFQQGLTPNPDILCNSRIKFQLLSDHAKKMGFDGLATGHYAHIEHRDGQYALLQAPDAVKDQTYFLSQLSQEQLSYAHFPLGAYCKEDTRRMAREFHLPNAERKDSVGICFIGERKFDHFLQNYLLTKPGDMVTKEGIVIGQHQGLFCYTIGQRKGLGIGGIKNSQPSPWYVIEKDLANNQLILSQNASDLLKSHVKVEPIHWIRGQPEQTVLQLKLRHGPEFVEGTLLDEQTVKFSKPQSAPAPGQHVVFYHQGECLGGSMILEAYT
ncbi:tRNA 2-thiouridine(34) synthase MnmA [Candidatus Synchoanobacter obligatus]|uniref:tRNA-specific 2-thiouridylase MnmA n=1 Tax=Candidatus Synchoanobacter obligatus TaxID=2919597 RepID=A0ABT1L776_9GAMM|nr:tRNA 2-thiouridine(34) synthase MnmA [Candidatus Synchoanobacter obligatus]MCP8352608.1 tRNA 2-thiouridine(34) synthase MnmA [Candidatus Synchoanobacter obligatus]